MLDIEARVLICWYSLASQSERVPTRCFYGGLPFVRYYLGITTDRNYQLLELPLINVGNSNVGNSEVFDRNFHFLIVSYRNYHCFLAAHRHLLVANFSCYGPSDDSHTILQHALYCDKP